MSYSEITAKFDVKDWLETRGEKFSRSGHTHVVMKDCPLCGDHRWKVYVNTSGSDKNGFWNSYCCQEAGALTKLVVAVEGFHEAEGFPFIRRWVDGTEDDLIPLVVPEKAARPAEILTDLPTPLYPASIHMPVMIKGRVGTLLERVGSASIIDRHRLMVTGIGTRYRGEGGMERRRDYDNRLIVPVISDGQVKTWQGRDLTGEAYSRYVFPAGDCSGSLLYDFDTYLGYGPSTLMLVEGVFHKWAWDVAGEAMGNSDLMHMTCASFGKKLSWAQEELIVGCSKIERLIFAWDLDAMPQVIKIADRLLGRKDIWVMPPHPSGRDPDELTVAERIDLFGSSFRYDLGKLARLNAEIALAR